VKAYPSDELNTEGPAPNKPNRSRLDRIRPADERELFADYAANVGAIVAEWAVLHSALFILFWVFVGDRGRRARDLATELWNSAPSDTAQRRMLGIIANNGLINDRANLTKVEWLLKAVDDLSAYRNIVAHVPIEFQERRGKTQLMDRIDGVRRAAGLRRLYVEYQEGEFWNKLSSDLYVLSQYTEHLAAHIVFPNPQRPLPYRPRLLSLPAIRRANAQVNQWLQAPRPRRRRRASRNLNSLLSRPHLLPPPYCNSLRGERRPVEDEIKPNSAMLST
jgi:hypothetical protein